MTDPAHSDKSDLEKSRLLIEQSKVLMEKYDSRVTELMSDPSTVVDDEFSPSLKSATESRRFESLGIEPPEELSAIDLPGWDSEFTDVQEDFQEAEDNKDAEGMNKLRGRLYSLAKERADVVPEKFEYISATGLTPKRKFGRPPGDKELRDYTRARAITGLSINEITNRELEGGYELPETLLDPKWVILFDGIETVEEFKALKQTEEGKKRIDEVYDALPSKYQVGSDNFFNLQLTLFMRYR